MQVPIKLRSLQMADIKSYYQIVKEPSVARGANFPGVKTLEQAQKMLATDLKSGRSLAIILHRQLIGVVNLYPTIGKGGVPNDHRLELGYFMNPVYQNRGYMTDAVNQLIGLVERSPKVRKLVADVSEDNVASIKVLKRNGFVSYRSVLDLTQNHEDLIFERSV